MTQRDQRTIFIGAGALVALSVMWFLILPWIDNWGETRAHIEQSHQRLEEFQEQTRRLIAQDRQLEPVLGSAVKKPLSNIAAARTQLIKDVTELYGRAGAEIRSVQPEAARPLADLPGVSRLTVQVQCMCQPVQLVQLLTGAKNNPNLILLDRVETTSSGRGPMNVTMVWSALARAEGGGNE